MMSHFIQFFTFTIIINWACTSVANDHSNEDESPNIFLYLADDLGRSDLGITGNPFVETPTIDSFAADAIRFDNMYTPTAMCAPSRSALMTGLYPHRNGCHMNHGATNKDVLTLPSYLIPLGYKVALVGKKHIRPKDIYPFDYVSPGELSDYLKDITGPLCLIYASDEPHAPHIMDDIHATNTLLPAKWMDTPKTREKIAGYYNDIAIVDREFKELLGLTQKYNLDRKSITIFTSDHGYEFFAKWTCYEAGLKVPFFLKAKGIDFSITKTSHLTSFVDLVPTFIEVAGGIPPEELDGQSLVPLLNGSTQPLHQYIYGTHTTRGIYSGQAFPIRSITDGRWKYIRNLNHRAAFQNILTNGWNFDPVSDSETWLEWQAMAPSPTDSQSWVSYYQHRPHEELYDLNTDPHEIKNLAEDELSRAVINRLSKELDIWMKDQGDRGLKGEMAVPLKAKDMSKIPAQ